ncbi:MAG: hypothetical protein ACRDJE_14770, partial [Dehalococcoidia bacterium]
MNRQTARPFLLLLAVIAALTCACNRDGSGPDLPEGAVLVAIAGGEQVVALDPTGERVLARLEVGREPHMLDMTPDRRTALAAVTQT